MKYLINTNTGKTAYGEPEWLDLISILSNRNVTEFVQDSLPEKDFPYWRVEGGEVVSKTDEEVAYIKAVDNYKKIKAKDFLGYRYKLEVPPAAVAEPTSTLAKVIRMLADPDVGQDTNKDNGNVRAYFNTINPDDVSLLSDDRFVIFDSDIYNPDSDQYIAP